MSKKPQALADVQPSCGACGFCMREEDQLFCVAMPPVIREEDGENVVSRGVPVEAEEPPCIHFKAKQ